MNPLPLSAFALLTPVVALAGIDQPWNEVDDGGNGNVIVGMVALGILAFIIHLIEKGEFLGFLKDIAKGVSFLATMYLGVFFFLACMLVIALLPSIWHVTRYSRTHCLSFRHICCAQTFRRLSRLAQPKTERYSIDGLFR